MSAPAFFLSLCLVLLGTTRCVAEQTVRFATLNAALNKPRAGDLIDTLSRPDNAQAKTIAEIIQRVSPDVILLNELDFDADGAAAALFQRNYLEVGQNGQPPIHFRYVFNAPSNTGIPSGFDLDHDGRFGGAGDAFGFGDFPGQYGMVVLSKYPIMEAQTRTFQKFLWRDMPGALLPDDPATAEPADWYGADELAVVRLSSKSHWDIVIDVAGETVHLLAAHPTPPVFDGPEDRNGRRNHDEIRFWADYIDPQRGQYIVDDRGRKGGLPAASKFVILGDYNADPVDGDSTGGAADQLLGSPWINRTVTPRSPGGIDAAARQDGVNDQHRGDPGLDTADFADRGSGPGNLRIDYVLPSRNMQVRGARVFWPAKDDPLFSLVGDYDSRLPGPHFPSSDHRLVYADVVVVPEPASAGLFLFGLMLWAIKAGKPRRHTSRPRNRR